MFTDSALKNESPSRVRSKRKQLRLACYAKQKGTTPPVATPWVKRRQHNTPSLRQGSPIPGPWTALPQGLHETGVHMAPPPFQGMLKQEHHAPIPLLSSHVALQRFMSILVGATLMTMPTLNVSEIGKFWSPSPWGLDVMVNLPSNTQSARDKLRPPQHTSNLEGFIKCGLAD